MRRRMVIVGVILLVVGAAIWYAPLEPVSATSTMPGTLPYRALQIGITAPFDFFGARIPITLSWSASSTVSISVDRCGTSPCNSTNQFVASGNGASGSLSWSGEPNVYYVVERVPPSGVPIQVTTKYTEPLLGGSVGLALTAFGVFVTVLGLWLVPPTQRKAPSAPSRSPQGESSLNDPRF